MKNTIIQIGANLVILSLILVTSCNTNIQSDSYPIPKKLNISNQLSNAFKQQNTIQNNMSYGKVSNNPYFGTFPIIYRLTKNPSVVFDSLANEANVPVIKLTNGIIYLDTATGLNKIKGFILEGISNIYPLPTGVEAADIYNIFNDELKSAQIMTLCSEDCYNKKLANAESYPILLQINELITIDINNGATPEQCLSKIDTVSQIIENNTELSIESKDYLLAHLGMYFDAFHGLHHNPEASTGKGWIWEAKCATAAAAPIIIGAATGDGPGAAAGVVGGLIAAWTMGCMDTGGGEDE